MQFICFSRAFLRGTLTSCACSLLIDPVQVMVSYCSDTLTKHLLSDPMDLLGHCVAPCGCRNRTYHYANINTDTYTTRPYTLYRYLNTITQHPTHSSPITRGLTHKHHCPHELHDVILRLVQFIMWRLFYALNSSSCYNKG